MPNHVHGIVVIRERLVVPVGADHDRPGIATEHDRPDTIHRSDTMPDHDANSNSGSSNAMNDGPDDRTANAPAAQMRADHDRPLRPPTPDAPPKRTMPIVPVGSLGRIVRAYKPACRQAGPPLHAWRTAMGCCPTARPYGNAIIGTV